MKSVIMFYSYSGNTKSVAETLRGILAEKGEVRLIEIKAQDESPSFLAQCRRAFSKKRAVIEDYQRQVGDADMVCFGTPVWAFGPAPAMNACLDQCEGIAGKQVVLFATCGSGVGSNKCLDYMQEVLAKKGAAGFRRFLISQRKIQDPGFVVSHIKKFVPL
jgi:flavodoxin